MSRGGDRHPKSETEAHQNKTLFSCTSHKPQGAGTTQSAPCPGSRNAPVGAREQPACCLWKGDCSAGELAHKDRVWSLQGSLFLLQCLCVGILPVSRGSKGRESIAKPYVTSSPVKRCMLGLPLPTQRPACRHASTLLFALGRRDLPQDHLPPLLCICSFSACQTFSEFKRSYKR